MNRYYPSKLSWKAIIPPLSPLHNYKLITKEVSVRKKYDNTEFRDVKPKTNKRKKIRVKMVRETCKKPNSLSPH